jgi:hypothetical protein
MFSNCANPDCRVSFDYRQGRIFRFHKTSCISETTANTKPIKHYWLCEACTEEFTLEYQNDTGVMLKSRNGPGCTPEVKRAGATA